MGLFRAPNNIVRHLKTYDPGLSVEWSDKGCFWEIHYQFPNGKKVLVTPVTESIYEIKGKRTFTPLDERIIAWLYGADTWKHKDGEEAVSQLFNSDLQKEYNKYKRNRALFKDLAKDSYSLLRNFYVGKQATKNPKHPKISPKVRQFGNWVKPDVRLRTSPRLFHRSKANVRLKFGQ